MILFINACVRRGSRTRQLADNLIARLLETEQPDRQPSVPTEAVKDAKAAYTVEEVCLESMHFPKVNEAFIENRTQLVDAGRLDDALFAPARQFASADTIVMAAPYWDLSFPAVLKQYLEQICVTGITFRYTPEGYPEGLCLAKKLYYVTTAGGNYFPEEFGFGYVRALAQSFFGIPEIRLVSAIGLDLVGADPAAILQASIDSMTL